MKKVLLISLTILMSVVFFTGKSYSCTNYIVTKSASTDGSVIISYAADSHVLYGELYFWSSADHKPGEMLDIYEWDTGKWLGKIEQVPHTYSVIGNMNEHQVSIGETTYGGKEELGKQTGAIMDYGSLIYITLQRAKTAREAIKIMGELVEKYGYASSGESFSISDANEAWILELIGKGEGEKGAVWVAVRIPDGYVSGHANHPRITTFALNDPQSCIYSKDVVSFARKKGYTPETIKDAEFSFSDTYAPVDFSGARFCEIRVWTFFNRVCSGMEKYWEYAKGTGIEHDSKTGYANNRMPLYVKPDKKVSVYDVMNAMRDHLEGTELDMAKDAGAEPFGVPYRWRPLTWKVGDVAYCNERATATQQTGFVFVSQSRSWLPDPIGGIHWFGVDDASSTVFNPIYCGITKVPESYQRGNGKMMEWANSAFWVFNQVSNWAYTRYNVIHPEIATKQKELETKYIEYTPAVDKAAEMLYKQNPASGVQFITDYTVNTANRTVYEWQRLYEYLFLKYMDGNVKEKDGDNQNPKLDQPGY
ncbi:MAG: C69 family dipeptidase, partial [Bacteroidetes bacterium]|nr:C69 family dipeptidase [Bacteroidota bacterium]